MELIGAMFPDSMSDFAGLLDDTAIVIDAEEQSVRDILGCFPRAPAAWSVTLPR